MVKNNKLLSYVLSINLIAMLFNNHSALFIADFYILLVIACALSVLYIITNANKCTFNVYNTCAFFAFVVLILMSFINKEIRDNGTFLSYVVWFALYISISSFRLTPNNINTIINGYILGAFICAILVFVLKIEYRTIGEYRYTIQVFNNVQIDPNYLGLFLLIPSLFLLKKIIKKPRKILNWIVFAVILYGMFLTGSRANLLAFFGALCFYIIDLFIKTNKKTRKRIYILICCALLVFVVLIQFLPPSVYDRFFHMNLFDTSNSLRLSHWKAALDAIKLRPLFGYGSAHTLDVLTKYANHRSDAHNTFLTLLIHFGIVGTVFFAIIFINIFYKLLKAKKISEIGILFATFFVCLIIANHLGFTLWITIILLQNIAGKIKKSEKLIVQGELL